MHYIIFAFIINISLISLLILIIFGGCSYGENLKNLCIRVALFLTIGWRLEEI